MLSMKLSASASSARLSQSTSYGIGAPQISSISFTRPGNVTSCSSLILRRSFSPMLPPISKAEKSPHLDQLIDSNPVLRLSVWSNNENSKFEPSVSGIPRQHADHSRGM